MDERQATAWLSDARFSSFLTAAEGDHGRAVSLYEWHVDLSAALFASLRGVEVVVRNAVDGVLGSGQPQTPLHETWLLDLGVLQPGALKQVVIAVERLGRREATRDEVVAMLPFGFWAAIFGRRYDRLWQTRLHRAFPHGVASRVQVAHAIGRIHRLRNRIAHHDSLLGFDVDGVVRDVATVAGWVDPAAAAWLRRVGRVEVVLARRP